VQTLMSALVHKNVTDMEFVQIMREHIRVIASTGILVMVRNPVQVAKKSNAIIRA